MEGSSFVPKLPGTEESYGRKIETPHQNEHGYDVHPGWGLIGAHRVQTGPDGAVLFDSDIRHNHTVIVRISTAQRQRNLNRDWVGQEREFVEVEMSEAQWASFVSSMNTGDGVPCTIRRREGDMVVPGMPYEPRLQESMAEVRGAAEAAKATLDEAFAAVEAKPTKANIRTLKFAIQNMPSNMEYAARSLGEHAENVVQRARADIEAMVMSKAHQLGLEPGDLGVSVPQLGPGE